MAKTKDNFETAIFAGGCFWCTQNSMDHVKGVVSSVVGYTGGDKAKPTYEQVSTGTTGHVEAIEVTFDPKKVTYEELLKVFWHSIDPTTNEGQFCDIGSQYKPVIFYTSEEQKKLAEKSKKEVSEQVGTVLVDILPAKKFYPAEEYHQEYYKKNPLRYMFYKTNSGRDARLKQLWGKHG